MENDSDSVDTLTSSDCSDESDVTLSDNGDNGSDDETESYRSLAFSVQSDRSTATVKSNKTKKRVRFKPGDKLVLVYIIPNREMLGLKSESEDSEDSDDDGDDSDDEDEVDDDDDDDDDDESEEDEEDEEEEDEDGKVKKVKEKKPRPFAKLMAIKQITKHKKKEKKETPKPAREKSAKVINLNLASAQKPPRRNSRASRRREKKERNKSGRKENNVAESKPRQGRSKRNKGNAISVDIDKPKRSRRGRPGILEIKATVTGDNKQETTASVPKLVYKNDLKPSVVNVNGALTVCQTKLLQRSKLQPVSLKVSKGDNNRPSSGSTAQPQPEKQTSVRTVVSASYESLTSLLPDSYNGFRHSMYADALKTLSKRDDNDSNEMIKRLNPDSMTDSSKRHYAWQVANGNISSQSLRTPSILPFWDSLKGSVPENTIKLPT